MLYCLEIKLDWFKQKLLW